MRPWPAVIGLAIALGAAGRARAGGDDGVDGAALYDRLCVACHGARGDGAGPAAPWLWPKPRDFTGGWFRWVTTADGAPTRDALRRTIGAGAPGTSMPGF